MSVRRLRPDEVELFRTLRLAALAADPDAFASDLERESAFEDRAWERPLADDQERPRAVFAAFAGSEPVGMTGLGEQDGEVLIWGMWVDPRARRAGVARRLLDAATTWAASIGATALRLWVVRSNPAAVELYRRAGFEPVENGTPPPPPGCIDEQFMRRPL